MNKQIYFIRHGESTKNINDLFGDEKCSFELTDKGIAESKRIVERLKAIINESKKDFKLFTSPDLRSTMTTDIISNLLNCNYEVINSMLPIKAGKLSGISEEEAINTYPKIMIHKKKFREGSLCGYNISYPEGENVKQFQNRVLEDFNQIANQSCKIIFIISHQSVITAILSFIKAQLEKRDFYYYWKIDLLSISKVTAKASIYDIEYINSI